MLWFWLLNPVGVVFFVKNDYILLRKRIKKIVGFKRTVLEIHPRFKLFPRGAAFNSQKNPHKIKKKQFIKTLFKMLNKTKLEQRRLDVRVGRLLLSLVALHYCPTSCDPKLKLITIFYFETWHCNYNYKLQISYNIILQSFVTFKHVLTYGNRYKTEMIWQW